jgi:O-antigen/teichoic acid export membrane protein
MSLKKQLIQGGLGSIFVKVIGTGLSFILSVILARMLGAEGFGIYSFVFSLLVFLSIPIQAGFPNLVVRETAKSFSIKDWPLIKGLSLWVFKLISIYVVSLASLVALLYLLGIDWLEKDRLDVFFIGFLLIALIPVLLVQNAVIRGLGRVVLGVVPDSILRPGFTILIIALVFLVSNESLTPSLAILSYVVSVMFSIIVSGIIVWKLTPKENRNINALNQEVGKWKTAVYPLTVVGGLQLMYGYIDIIILGIFQSNAEVGVYRAVGQFGTLVVFGLMAINQMLHSHFARLYAANEMAKLQKIVTYSSLAIFVIALIPSLIFFFAGEFLLKMTFGEEYVIGFLPLIILTVGQLANAVFGSVGALLNMTGHEKDAMKGMLYSLGINLLLAFILIPLYGMIGAATATAISLIVWNVILRHYVKKRLNIESIGFIQILTQKGI